jgi:hypothetical protein
MSGLLRAVALAVTDTIVIRHNNFSDSSINGFETLPKTEYCLT